MRSAWSYRKLGGSATERNCAHKSVKLIKMILTSELRNRNTKTLGESTASGKTTGPKGCALVHYEAQ